MGDKDGRPAPDHPGPCTRLAEQRRFSPGLSPVVAVGGDECRRHKEVMFWPVHLDRRAPHQNAGDGKRVLKRRRDAELLDEVESLEAVTLVTDKMPGFADRRGALDHPAGGAGTVPGLFRVHKIAAADQASGSMLHAIGVHRPRTYVLGLGGSSGSGRRIGGMVAPRGSGLLGEVSSPELLHPPLLDREDAISQVQE